MKKQYKNTNKPQKVAEPAISYQPASRIKFYHSFEEAKLDEIAFAIQQSPIERLRHTVELILRAYGLTAEKLRNRKKSNQIKIIRTKQS